MQPSTRASIPASRKRSTSARTRAVFSSGVQRSIACSTNSTSPAAGKAHHRAARGMILDQGTQVLPFHRPARCKHAHAAPLESAAAGLTAGTTPTNGRGNFSRSTPSATTEAVLQATTIEPRVLALDHPLGKAADGAR